MTLDDAIQAAVAQALAEELPRQLAVHLAALAVKPAKLAYTIPEASQQSALSEKHLYGLLKTGALRGTRGGKQQWIVAHADLLAYLTGQPVPIPFTEPAERPARQRKASGQVR